MARSSGAVEPEGPERDRMRVDLRNVMRATVVVLAVVAVASFLSFVLRDGGSVIFTVLMAWFASIAIEPAVARLATRMPRGVATAIVMGAIGLFLVVFLWAFGQLFLQQIATLLRSLPGLVSGALERVNERLGTSYEISEVLSGLNITQAQVTEYAGAVLGGVFGLLGSVVGAVFGLFTFGLLTFYLSADGPRLRRWLASLFPTPAQRVVATVWDVTAQKTGGYVAARVILALINGGTSAVVFLLIGMPSWLALGVWTGLVAQFVPTIGTYIAIALPVLVGLLSGSPWIGLAALAWALVYQQVENLTLEPRISAKATDVHPALAFTSVLLGGVLFGVAGALLAVPVVAMLMSLVQIYVRRHEVVDEARPAREGAQPQGVSDDAAPAGLAH